MVVATRNGRRRQAGRERQWSSAGLPGLDASSTTTILLMIGLAVCWFGARALPVPQSAIASALAPDRRVRVHHNRRCVRACDLAGRGRRVGRPTQPDRVRVFTHYSRGFGEGRGGEGTAGPDAGTPSHLRPNMGPSPCATVKRSVRVFGNKTAASLCRWWSFSRTRVLKKGRNLLIPSQVRT